MINITMKRVREIYTGLTLLAKEPIATHLLNFRLSVALTALEPLMVRLANAESDILKENCELGAQGDVRRSPDETPIWKDEKGEERAVADLQTILDDLVELPAGVKRLNWPLLEKATCVQTDKDGARKESALIVSVPVQRFLGDFIEGEPSDPTMAPVV